jgi:hypothetical protein
MNLKRIQDALNGESSPVWAWIHKGRIYSEKIDSDRVPDGAVLIRKSITPKKRFFSIDEVIEEVKRRLL